MLYKTMQRLSLHYPAFHQTSPIHSIWKDIQCTGLDSRQQDVRWKVVTRATKISSNLTLH